MARPVSDSLKSVGARAFNQFTTSFLLHEVSMPRLLSTLAILLALNTGFAIPRVAAASVQPTRAVAVMIQLNGPPLAADTNLKARTKATLGRFRLDSTLLPARWYSSALGRYQSSELHYLQAQGIRLSLRHQFRTLFNGFSAAVPASQVARLRSLSNVASVLPIRMYHPLLDRSLPLVHVPEAWTDLGGPANAGANCAARGEGSSPKRRCMIAQIDTGIDIKHPCFSDAGFPAPAFGRRSDTKENLAFTNNKVIVARAFGSDASMQYSAQDTLGHGTFGAAIEACDYNTSTPLGTRVSGVAPAAYLMNYNVFADPNGAGFDVILAGLEAALQDGADVANMSLGSDLGSGDPLFDTSSKTVNLATKAGMSVVISAGNAGPSDQTVSSPGVAADGISVGATSNSRGISSTLSVDGPAPVPTELAKIRANEGSHAFTGAVGPAQVVYVGLGRLPNDDTDSPTANDFAGKDLHGKIALIQRGTIFFETKINNAAKAGAIGAVIYDNQDELNLLSMDVKTATLPAMSVSQDSGKKLLAVVQAHPDTQVTLHSETTTFEETPDVLTDFSSRGYAADYSIKPDLVAPGQDIYSATTSIPNSEIYNPSGWATEQGTSFSAPHVAGAVALVLQKHPLFTPAMVKDLLVQTAGQNVVLDPRTKQIPSIAQMGGGLLNVASALSVDAYVSPTSTSLGEINVANGPAARGVSMTLNDVGGGSGAWQVSVDQLHGGNGFGVTVPGTVDLPASGHVDFNVQFAIGTATATQDYGGYILLTHGSQVLHVPYFAHVVSQAVKPGTVLLVDATASRFVPTPPNAPLVHKDFSSYYENALKAIGQTYTYWNEGVLGSPSIQDMRPASAVIYFTGANLNGFNGENSNSQALNGPLSSVDVSAIHSYVNAGGRVFVSGTTAAVSDLDWTACVLGAGAGSLSVYDNASNDKTHQGGISPPQPSAVPDARIDVHENRFVFGNMKAIDFSTKGDGAGDNVARYSTAVETDFGNGLVGVTGLTPVTGKIQPCGSAYGQAALRTTALSLADAGADVATVSSDEPSLTHRASYRGRTVFFSFGFEGINNNTGFATREQVLRRIFQWFDDKPTATVTSSVLHSGVNAQLRAALHALGGVRAAQYTWQIGKTTLKASTKPVSYRFSRPGQYKIRVAITDSLGHVAVSGWKTVTVR